MNAQLKGFLPGSQGLLEPLNHWLKRSDVTEILINKPREVWVESRDGMTKYGDDLFDETYMKRLSRLIANENSQEISEAKPFLSGELYDGSRIQIVQPPAARHYTLSIRRKSLKEMTFEDYEAQGFFNNVRLFSFNYLEVDESPGLEHQELLKLYSTKTAKQFLKKAIALRKNILVCGGTSSGKTTFLNACGRYIPRDERIITLEDTLEVRLPHENQVNLKAPENSDINMSQLVKTSLRLRPDRIIVGELRDKEVLDFISACSTGHDGSIATIHASNPKLAIQRMIQLYKRNNVPAMRDEEIRAEILSVIDCFVQLHKHPVYGREIKYIAMKGVENGF